MKTEMSSVDNFSWFLTVTFDCRHLLWHFHCGEADVHIFGWIGLMLSIQLCPYLPVSIQLCCWDGQLYLVEVEQWHWLEWGVDTTVFGRRALYTTPVSKCPHWARWYAANPNKDTFVIAVIKHFKSAPKDFLGFPDSSRETQKSFWAISEVYKVKNLWKFWCCSRKSMHFLKSLIDQERPFRFQKSLKDSEIFWNIFDNFEERSSQIPFCLRRSWV